MEFEDVVVKENPGLCRCCLSEGCYKDLGTEYIWMNETEVYADMLLECFDISISQHIEGPNGPNRLICEVCITRLRDACNFKKQVLESEKKFVDMVGRGEFRPKVVIYQPVMKSEVVTEAPVEEDEVEYLEDEMDFDDADDEPLKRPDDAVPGVSGSEEITVSTLKVKGKRGRPKKSSSEKPEKKAKVAKLDDKPRSSKTVTKDLTGSLKEDGREIRRSNLITLINYTTIKPFKWQKQYKCYYCQFSTNIYSRLKEHYTKHIYCDFDEKSLVAIKLDVSNISCEICDEAFSTVDALIFHLVAKHFVQYDPNVDMNLEMYRLCDLTCLICGLTFTYFQKLVLHLKNEHQALSFKTEFYGKSLQMLNTMKTDNVMVEIKCIKCKQEFKNIRSFKKHKLQSHGVTNQIAKLEPLSRKHLLKGKETEPELQPQNDFTNKKECTTTEAVKTNIRCILKMTTALPFKFYKNLYMCYYCPELFREHDEVLTHVNEHTVAEAVDKLYFPHGKSTTVKLDVTFLSCRVCDEKFDDLDSIADHLVSAHEATYNSQIKNLLHPYKLAKDDHICLHCKKPFKYFQLLLKHVKNEHLVKTLLCSHCGMQFQSRSSLSVHINIFHKVKGYKCTICSEVFTTYHRLKSHKSSLHKTEFPCKKCKEMFPTSYAAEKHMLNVHNIGYVCQDCGHAFVRKSFMVNHHRRVHLKEKEIPCNICNKMFFNKALLSTHMVKHTRERRYTCDACGKSFLWKKNLTQHVDVVHNNAKAVKPEVAPSTN